MQGSIVTAIPNKHHVIERPSDAASFLTNDGVELVYRDSGGTGIPLLMLPGLGQSQMAFHRQFDGLRDRRRVITMDFRAHGFSSTPSYGYRIARFAADVLNLMDHLHLDRVDALGWSMGASVWWSFIDLYGTRRLHRLVIVDQPSAIASVPWMTEDEQVSAGVLWDLSTVEQVTLASREPNPTPIEIDSLGWTYTGEIDPDVLETIAAGMRMGSSVEVGRILFDHCVQDWRDVLPRIDVPTLVTGAEGSHVSTESQRRTAAAIPEAQVHIFPTHIASSHFPFLQSPAAFNEVLEDFLK
jgi:pimeloyl-ACP methyl ester carboxylesterase